MLNPLTLLTSLENRPYCVYLRRSWRDMDKVPQLPRGEAGVQSRVPSSSPGLYTTRSGLGRVNTVFQCQPLSLSSSQFQDHKKDWHINRRYSSWIGKMGATGNCFSYPSSLSTETHMPANNERAYPLPEAAPGNAVTLNLTRSYCNFCHLIVQACVFQKPHVRIKPKPETHWEKVNFFG